MLDVAQHSLLPQPDAVVSWAGLPTALRGGSLSAVRSRSGAGRRDEAAWGDPSMPASVPERLRKATEFYDSGMWNHVVRVGHYSRVIAVTMGMPKGFWQTLFLAAPLHDIGKMGIPQSILLKPGPLSDDEWRVMQRHCEMGTDILRQFAAWLPSAGSASADFALSEEDLQRRRSVLEMAAVVALTHHERWDGGGYPQRLAGDAIPIESRIVAIADVFDALTSDRPYRNARPEEEALSIIDATVGSHFDPYVHAVFVRSLPAIRAIRSRFADEADAGCSEDLPVMPWDGLTGNSALGDGWGNPSYSGTTR
jgi:putative two-component system response regulator